MQTHLAIQQKAKVRKGTVKEILMPSQIANLLISLFHVKLICKPYKNIQNQMKNIGKPNQNHTKPQKRYNTLKNVKKFEKNIEHCRTQ